MNIQDLAIAVNESERTGYKPVGERAYTPIGEKSYETNVDAHFVEPDDQEEREHRRLVREEIMRHGYPDPGPNFENNPPFIIRIGEK